LLVLYNGLRRWDTATETRGLLALSPDSPLWPWQPQVRYHLMDIGAFPKGELVRRSGLVALLFRLEQQPPPEEFEGLLGEVIGWFRQHEGLERLQRLFAELVHRAFAGLETKVRLSDDLLEMKTMISTLGETWKQQWLAEGKAEGKVEGKVEGRMEGKIEGKAEALVCLLVERFGILAPSLRRQIRGARLKTLDCWFKRAIVAPDLRSVFDPPR
jgi:hypothetical protein